MAPRGSKRYLSHVRYIPGCLPVKEKNNTLANCLTRNQQGSQTVVAETLSRRADLYVRPSAYSIPIPGRIFFPLLTSVVANVATLVAGTTGKQHLDGILKLDTHSVSHEHESFWQIRVVPSVPLLSLDINRCKWAICTCALLSLNQSNPFPPNRP